MESYSDLLAHKKEIIVLSKLDQLNEDYELIVQEVGKTLNKPIFFLSSVTGFNVTQILRESKKLVDEIRNISINK